MSRRGWRVWGITKDEVGPVLTSLKPVPGFREFSTFPERVSFGRCLYGCKDVPQADCRCGLYVFPRKEQANILKVGNYAKVHGRVDLIGRVVDGGPGLGALDGELRAASLRLSGPQAITTEHAADADALTARYGVPFIPDPTLHLSPMDAISAAGRERGRQWMSGWVDCACGVLHWGSRGAAGLVLVDQTRQHVVLSKRSVGTADAGSWALLGGALDADETPTEAALREAWEEAGVKASRVTVLDVVPGIDHGTWRYDYVVAETHWDGADHVLPGPYFSREIEGACWVPISAVDRWPGLLPQLADDWPRIRAAL